jgi:hypothetical protein
MQTLRIYRLTHLSPTMFGRLKAAQMAVSKERGRVVLPIGRGRASIVLPLDLPEHSGACTLVWNRGFELHVCIEVHKPSMPLARTGPRWIWGRSTLRLSPRIREPHSSSQAVAFAVSSASATCGTAISPKSKHAVRSIPNVGRNYNAPGTRWQVASNCGCAIYDTKLRSWCLASVSSTRLAPSSSATRMACARRTKDGITTSVWHSGSTAVISTISRTKVHKPASRASLARNEEQAASVRYVGININQEAECGSAGTVGSWGIVTW